ncbi:hypothetical protein AOXY_G12687 [Acipenser oxyrinchus oxyrinchus]|uniref:Dynein heavy chain coiled coil stalk domain-containing protein n=1 Tax=Acipenser oxyrinchus oxyrinchus TaxID=40147 RepID=A0AAD8G2D5_ACIOX|nr:hypothetical protein AOXY_G12687 [Acipenser oxyrinchus oxyrinchus]
MTTQVEDLKLVIQEVECHQRNKDTEALIAKIGQQTEQLNQDKAIADAEEQRVAAIQAEVTKQLQKSEEDLVKAEPALNANAALNTLNRVDDFLEALIHFDKEHIPEGTVRVVKEEYLRDPEFNPEFVWTKTSAAAGLCAWVINIICFHEVYCEVELKRRKLSQASTDQAGVAEKLEVILRMLCKEYGVFPLSSSAL